MFVNLKSHFIQATLLQYTIDSKTAFEYNNYPLTCSLIFEKQFTTDKKAKFKIERVYIKNIIFSIRFTDSELFKLDQSR
jgi:hypothetical protein